MPSAVLPARRNPNPNPNQVDWLHSSLEAEGAPRGTLGASLASGGSSYDEQTILEMEARPRQPHPQP